MQTNGNITSFHYCKEKTSSLRKRLVVFFIFSCMFLNGFASSISADKYSFAMILVSMSKTAAVQLFSKCSDSIRDVSSKVCIDIMKLMLPSGDMMCPADNSKKEEKQNGATGSDYAAILNAQNFFDKRVKACESGAAFLPGKILFDIFAVFEQYTFYGENSKLIMILFLIFIISVRRRKGRGETELAVNNLTGHKRIPA